MKYVPPVGGAAGAPYVDASPGLGVEGDAVPAAAIEAPLREIDHTITVAGLTPNPADLTQLAQAIQALIAAAIGGLSVKQKSVIATAQTFAPGVANGDPVRWDAVNTRWAKAQADGTTNDLGLGIADITNAEVVLYGETRAGLVAGLTPGAAYYLSATGTLVTNPAADAVKVGVAKSATALYVDFDPYQRGIGAGLEDDGVGNLRAKLDGGTLVRSGSGLKVNPDLSISTLVTSGNETVGGNLTVNGVGGIRAANKPAFLVYRNAAANGVAGIYPNMYTVPFDKAVFDQTGSVNLSTGIFTAPVTGLYRFSSSVAINNMTSVHTSGFLQLMTSGQNPRAAQVNPYAMRDVPDAMVALYISELLFLNSGDTAKVGLMVGGDTANNINLYVGAQFSRFSGELVG